MEEPTVSAKITTLTAFAFTAPFHSRRDDEAKTRTRASRHTLANQVELGPTATGDLTLLLTAIQTTCRFIAHNVRRAKLVNLFGAFSSCSSLVLQNLEVLHAIVKSIGAAGNVNVQGEDQKKLDILAFASSCLRVMFISGVHIPF